MSFAVNRRSPMARILSSGALGAAALMAGLSALPQPVAAQTTIGPGTGSGDASTGVSRSGSRGQSFVSPRGFLSSFSANITSVTPGSSPLGSYSFQIHDYNAATNSIGTRLYSSTFSPAVGVFTASNINLATVQGQSYAAIFTPFGASPDTTSFTLSLNTSNPYADGRVFGIVNANNPTGQTGTGNANLDLMFSATFAPPAPEPGSWALMILGFGIVGGTLRRRRAKEQPQLKLAAA